MNKLFDDASSLYHFHTCNHSFLHRQFSSTATFFFFTIRLYQKKFCVFKKLNSPIVLLQLFSLQVSYQLQQVTFTEAQVTTGLLNSPGFSSAFQLISTVSILPWISCSLSLFSGLFWIDIKAPTMTAIIVTFIYHSFSVLLKGLCIYLVFCFPFFSLWSARTKSDLLERTEWSILSQNSSKFCLIFLNIFLSDHVLLVCMIKI